MRRGAGDRIDINFSRVPDRGFASRRIPPEKSIALVIEVENNVMNNGGTWRGVYSGWTGAVALRGSERAKSGREQREWGSNCAHKVLGLLANSQTVPSSPSPRFLLSTK